MFRWNNIACDTLDELVALMQRVGSPLPEAKPVPASNKLETKKGLPDPLKTIAKPVTKPLNIPLKTLVIDAEQARRLLSILFDSFNTRKFTASAISLSPSKLPTESDANWAWRRLCLHSFAQVRGMPINNAISLGFLLRKLHRLNLTFKIGERTYRLTAQSYGGQTLYAFKDLT